MTKLVTLLLVLLLCGACGLKLEPTDTFAGRDPDCYKVAPSAMNMGMGGYDCSRNPNGSGKDGSGKR